MLDVFPSLSPSRTRARRFLGVLLLSSLLLAACNNRRLEQGHYLQEADIVMTDPATASPLTLSGRVVSGRILVFLRQRRNVFETRFFLDDPRLRGKPIEIDDLAPFEVIIDTETLPAGEHTLTVAALVSQSRGIAREVLTVSFAVRRAEVGVHPPDVDSFTSDVTVAAPGREVTFSWAVSDADGDSLICSLDLDGDGLVERTFRDCRNTTRLGYRYPEVGSYQARLTVADGSSETTVRRTITVTSKALPETSERVHVFYYPWYGNPEFDRGKYGTDDLGWRHWQQHTNSRPRTPPDDIGSNYYPALAPYSNSDPDVIGQHMEWIAGAGIGVLVVSWWGPGSWEDSLTPQLLDQAAAYGLKIAFHLEPCDGCTVATVRDDIDYLYRRYGDHPAFFRVSKPTGYAPSTASRGVFYVFNVLDFGTLEQWKVMLDGIRGTPSDAFVLAQKVSKNPIEEGHFDGVYTYDTLIRDGSAFGTLQEEVAGSGGVFSASVGPGFDETRAIAGSRRRVSRDGGRRYDTMWRNAVASGAEWISITSFNEWHEGTQIEPAVSKSLTGYAYEDYLGAFGRTGAAAAFAYLDRTREWVELLLDEPENVGVLAFPGSVTMVPGERRDFRAIVTGTSDTQVRWSADEGVLVGGGRGHTVTYTAPARAGNFVLTATSLADPTRRAIINVSVTDPTAIVVESRVKSSDDDAEERSDGRMSMGSSDLELVTDGVPQVVGMRFTGVDIPRGATIVHAYIQFQVDEVRRGEATLLIRGEAVDDADAFRPVAGDISRRDITTALVPWSPAPWLTVGDAGPAQQTPNLAPVIQEIVNRPGWSRGNALALLVGGSGERLAESFDGDAGGAPLLHVEFDYGAGVADSSAVSGATGATPLAANQAASSYEVVQGGVTISVRRE